MFPSNRHTLSNRCHSFNDTSSPLRWLVFWLLAGTMLLTLNATAQAACYSDKDNTIRGKHNFFTKDYEGQIAWFKRAKPEQLHIVSAQDNNCYTIYPPSSGSISFIANNVTEKIEEDEVYAFLGVQIIRVLKTSNGRDIIRAMRKGEWTDVDGKVVNGFGSKTIPNMDWPTFTGLHSSNPFDPASIRLRRNQIWHASPVGGVLPSFDYPEAWISEFSKEGSNDIQVTNKLLRFRLNSGGGRVGVPFDVETRGAREVYVSVFSPERDAFTHFLKIIPGK